MVERVHEAFEGDAQLTVIGQRLAVGERAPAFALDAADQDGTISVVTLADSQGSIRLLNIVNSVDTPVCHRETRRWDDLRATLPSNARVYTLSMDLPFALARWQTSEQVGHQLLSAHRSEQFGQAYGVLIKEWRLLQRAVVVIGADDRIVYAEYVADQMLEPDYEAALEAIRQAAASWGKLAMKR